LLRLGFIGSEFAKPLTALANTLLKRLVLVSDIAIRQCFHCVLALLWYPLLRKLGVKMEKRMPLLPVKSDFVFRLIFGDQRNVDILAAFLRSVLDIPDDEYDHLTIVDPYLKKESEDDKYAILDVKLHTVSGSVIHIETASRAF
jgi:hypothetical protein